MGELSEKDARPRVNIAATSPEEAKRKVATWRAWRVYFETTARAQDAMEAVLRKGAGVTLAEYNVLVLLQEAKGHRLRFKDLAAKMSFSKSRLSYQVKVLEKRGLICRGEVEGDARGVYVQLTEEGWRTFLEAGKLHARQVEQLMLNELSTGEAEVIERVFTRLAKRLEESAEA